MSDNFQDQFVDLQDTLYALGQAVVRIVLERTRRGVDVDGVSFKPYNLKYAKWREEKTGFPPYPVNLTGATPEQRKRKKGKTKSPLSSVNLTATVEREQRMMSSDNIIHELNGSFDSVSVFMQYPGKEQLAYYHHISGAGKSRVIRRFFDLSDDEVTQLVELADEMVKKNIKVKTGEQLVALLKKLEVTEPGSVA